MRQWMAVVLALASAAGGCCMFGERPDAPPVAAEAGEAAEAPAGPAVVLDLALLERPAGDAFLNQGLWELGNEQCVDLETKPLLEENGLRVGLIGGLLPPRLQALLKSPRSNPDPRRLPAVPDHPAPVQVGPARAKLVFEARHHGQARGVELGEATCYFLVTPAVDGDGVRLRFTPLVRHGKARAEPRVARDPGGALRWSFEAREPVEEFPHLAWELTVGPDEYVLVGARLDQQGTLGPAYFLTADGRAQQLLAVRAWQLAAREVDDALHQSPPLAMQATWTARGSGR